MPQPTGPLASLAAVLVLAAVGCAPAGHASVPSTSSSAGGASREVPGCSDASFDALALQLRDYYCLTAEGSIASSELESCDDIETTITSPAGSGDGIDARQLRLAVPGAQVFLLVVCTDAGTETFFLHDLWDYTDEEATTRSEGSVTRLERVDLVPGGASELRLDIAFSRSRVLWHECILESQRRERTILCEATSVGPRCADLPSSTTEHGECDELCLIRQLGNDDPSCEGEGGATYDRELRLSLDLRGGRVRVTESSAIELARPAGLVGEHTLAELVASHPLEQLDLP